MPTKRKAQGQSKITRAKRLGAPATASQWSKQLQLVTAHLHLAEEQLDALYMIDHPDDLRASFDVAVLAARNAGRAIDALAEDLPAKSETRAALSVLDQRQARVACSLVELLGDAIVEHGSG